MTGHRIDYLSGLIIAKNSEWYNNCGIFEVFIVDNTKKWRDYEKNIHHFHIIFNDYGIPF